MNIRPATEADWPAIYPIFAAIVEAGETYAYPERLSREEAHELWMEQPPGITVVAFEDDEILGTAKAGPNRPARGAHVSTASFMVSPDRRVRGVGRALGEWILEWATREGYRSMQFNAVVETNAPAVHLWQSLGFGIIGTVPEAFNHREHGLVGLHVMWRALNG
jgi:L-amino acid N-acyltransferase YncA